MDVVGFGALNVDKIYLVDAIPAPGEEVFVKDLRIHSGGSASNTIVGLSKLGLETGYIGKVGTDPEGDFLMDDLRRWGVDTTLVLREEGRSGCAMILVDESGERVIVVDPGVNDRMRFEEIDLDHVSKFELLHLTSFVCRNGMQSYEAQKRLVREFDGIVSFDPGSIYARRGLKFIEDIVRETDIFMPNEIEMRALTGLDYKEGAEVILEMGVDVVVVKLGDKGCYITDGRKEIIVPAYEVDVVDTTGAGDAFNAGFIYAYLKGKDLEECGRMGNYVASLCIRNVGAKSWEP